MGYEINSRFDIYSKIIDVEKKVHLKKKKQVEILEEYEKPPFKQAFFTYFSILLLHGMGRLRDFLRNVGLDKNTQTSDHPKNKDFVPLFHDYEAFFTRNIFTRIRDCWDRPITGVAGAEIDTINRTISDSGWTIKLMGGTSRKMNLGSYNYLGFAETHGECANAAHQSIEQLGLGTGASRQEGGSHVLHQELESRIAEFTGQEAAIVTPMGFATNSVTIPALLDKHCCVISDQMNHASLILGIRLSGAQTVRFNHNDMTSLEKELRNAVVKGNKRTRRPFSKILIVVEGIYSMEGSITPLPEIIALKKRYKAFLYVDEAHSVGALGPNGRGVTDYFGCNPRDIDILMGTFTKSFGAAGGYIAGSRRLIDLLRCTSHGSVYGMSMSPPVCQQILSSMGSIMCLPGYPDGQIRLQQLAWNTRYFRRALHRMGLIVYGHRDSPVIPVMVFSIPKMVAICREAYKRGLAIVIAGFPATSLLTNRMRFCMSSSHTKEMLDKSLKIIEDISTQVEIRFSALPPPAWCMNSMETQPSKIHYTKMNEDKKE